MDTREMRKDRTADFHDWLIQQKVGGFTRPMFSISPPSAGPPFANAFKPFAHFAHPRAQPSAMFPFSRPFDNFNFVELIPKANNAVEMPSHSETRRSLSGRAQ
jgi:hypothetical protein